MLRAVISPDQADWVEKLPMVEFAINSSQSSTTGFAPFKLNYGYLPTLRGLLDEVPSEVKPGIRAYADRARQHLMEAHDAIIAARVDQTFYANQRRRPHPEYKDGDKVWLSTKNLTMPKGRVRKLMPKFIGPFTIIAFDNKTSNYRLELPNEMATRNIHDNFHANLLKPFIENDAALFPRRDAKYFYDYGEPEDTEWFVDEILSHRWNGRKIEFLVKWSLGDTTWEPYTHCKDLEALDNYLAILNVADWKLLPKKSQS
jgi:hypothetical protein